MRVRVGLCVSVFTACLSIACSSPSNAITGPSLDRGPQRPPAPPPLSGSCESTNAQWAIGERASAELLERARVAAGAGSARFLRPNEAITLEYLGSRLNLGLDARDVVASVICG